MCVCLDFCLSAAHVYKARVKSLDRALREVGSASCAMKFIYLPMYVPRDDKDKITADAWLEARQS